VRARRRGADRVLVAPLRRIKKESDLAKKVPRAPLLELYTNYFFDTIPAVQKREIFEVLCFNFLLFMMDKRVRVAVVHSFRQQSY